MIKNIPLCTIALISTFLVNDLAFGVNSTPSASEPRGVSSSTAGNIERQAWQLIGPGDADQVTSISMLTPSGDIVIGTDIGGLYKSGNKGSGWTSINHGLLNYDVTTRVAQLSPPSSER